MTKPARPPLDLGEALTYWQSPIPTSFLHCSQTVHGGLPKTDLYWQFMAVASFPGHFLALPTWPENEEYDPAFVSVQLGMFVSYVATR